MKRNCKTMLSFALSFAMVWGIVTPNANVASAAKAVKLSTKSVTIKVGSTKTVKVKNTKKKVTWSVKKGSKYISLTKKKTSVKIKGKKAGKATVQAKVGKKKLLCKVTVKKAATPVASKAPTPAPSKAPTSAPTKAPTASPTAPATTPTPTVPAGVDITPTAPAGGDATPTAPAGGAGEAVTDIDINLDGLTTSFTAPGYINFSSKLASNMDLAYFDKCVVEYTLDFEDGNTSDWNCGKVAIAVTADTLTGYDDGIKHNGYAMTADGTSTSIDLTGATTIGKPVGINIQPMNASYAWPTGLKTLTITGIKFIATPGAVYPAAGSTPKPTQVPLETYAPREFTYEGLDQAWIDKNIDPTKPMVAFTFDDGPVGTADTDTSMIIQNALHDNGCHATFNYIGSVISGEEKENEIKQAYAYGFELGNHSWNWASMGSLQDTAIRKSIQDTNDVLSELTGGKISNFTFRPPNLNVGGMMKGNIDAPFIDAAIDSKDWNKATVAQIIENVEKAEDGDIILMHETQATTAEAIPELIKYFKDKGWQIVSVSELFHVRNTPLMTDGTVYRKCPPAK